MFDSGLIESLCFHDESLCFHDEFITATGPGKSILVVLLPCNGKGAKQALLICLIPETRLWWSIWLGHHRSSTAVSLPGVHSCGSLYKKRQGETRQSKNRSHWRVGLRETAQHTQSTHNKDQQQDSTSNCWQHFESMK